MPLTIEVKRIKRKITPGRYKGWLVISTFGSIAFDPLIYFGDAVMLVREDDYGNRAITIRKKAAGKTVTMLRPGVAPPTGI